MKNTLKYLRKLLKNGTSPDDVALSILETILNPSDQLRYFATERAKNTFAELLKDPGNIKWRDLRIIEGSKVPFIEALFIGSLF